MRNVPLCPVCPTRPLGLHGDDHPRRALVAWYTTGGSYKSRCYCSVYTATRFARYLVRERDLSPSVYTLQADGRTVQGYVDRSYYDE